MATYVTLEQFMEVLAHNADNRHDSDIWVLHEDGSTEILPDGDIVELQSRTSWPVYICRVEAVNAHVTADTQAAALRAGAVPVDGLYAALDYLNWAIGMLKPTEWTMRNSTFSYMKSVIERGKR